VKVASLGSLVSHNLQLKTISKLKTA